MDNKIAKLLFLVGLVTIVFGGIVGIMFTLTDISGIMFLISAVVSGIFIIGFSEVIKLLDQINKKLDK